MSDLEWTCVANEVARVHGQGLVLAPQSRRDDIIQRLDAAGYTMIGFDGIGLRDFREAQAAVAEALRLPSVAGTNLDAMADVLGDLAEFWPEDSRILLIWENAQALITADLPGWIRLTDVLRDATDDLYRGNGEPEDRLFETLAFVEGMGV